MKKTKKLMAFLAAFVALTLLAGCGGGGNKQMVTDEALTCWAPYGAGVAVGVENMAELPVYQKLMEETGIKIEFTHPTAGQTTEQFNLMIASGEYPDIIEGPFFEYPGGPQGAIDEGVILPLNDIIEKYCPNLKKFLENNPELAKMMKTDEGNYYCFPGIYDGEYLLTFNGPIIRKDLLDKIGMERPETIDEWTEMLRKFRDELGQDAPLTVTLAHLYAFTQAFGAIPTLYVDNGVIKTDVMDESFKQALTCLRDWYAEGLLDKNIATVANADVKKAMINGDSVATIGATGGGLGTWTNSGVKNNPEYELIAAPYPVLKKGDRPKYGHRINPVTFNFAAASITTQCKNVEAAARLLDYGYGEEGRLLFNFGIEGESYEMIDGYPTYTEVVTKNHEGKAMSDMIGYYACPDGRRPAVRDVRYMEQFAALPQQKESITLWGETDAAKHLLPPVTLLSQESSEIAGIQTAIESYQDASILKFITGVESLDNFDNFVDTLKRMGIEKYIDAYQRAYDRYQQR